MTLQQFRSSPYRIPVLALVAIAALTLLVIMPLMNQTSRTEAENAQLATLIDMQKAFSPLVSTMKGDMGRLGKHTTLPAGTEVAPPSSLTEGLTALQQMATAASLRGVRFVPLAESVLGSNEHVRLDGTMDGPLEAFRLFMLQATSQRWVTRVEQLEVTAGPQSPMYKVSVWIQVGGTTKGNGG